MTASTTPGATGWVRDRQLPAVGLDELLSTAELLDRRDRKYVLTTAQLDALVAELPTGSRVLTVDGRSQQRYRSSYLDTATLSSFTATARQRPRRSKVRVRSYLDSDMHWLEVKVRDAAGRTVKHRRPSDGSLVLDSSARAFVDDVATAEVTETPLEVALTTEYARTTVLLPSDSERLTIDRDLRAHDRDGRVLCTTDLVVVETKSPDRPTAADHLLWLLGVRPVAISKYATCLAALDPRLPRNRWHRVLRDRIVPATVPERRLVS